MIDILGLVYDFILKYAQGEGVPPLKENQIVRGWQNSAVLPNNSEFVIITLLNSYRKGRNIHYNSNDVDYKETLDKLTEHVIQVDFCSNHPTTSTQVTQHRAEILETVASSYISCDFFKKADKRLNFLNCDGVHAFNNIDDTQNITCRYMMTLHITEHVQANLYPQTFVNVNIKTKEIDTYFKGDN